MGAGFTDMVESGELTLDDFVTKQSTWIAGIVNKYQQQPFNIKITVEKTPDCTLCGSPTRRRPGKNGDFFGCSKYPECKGIINIEPKKKSKQTYKKKGLSNTSLQPECCQLEFYE